MIVIGLTGSIGMGKSTIGAMMETMRIPVHESDEAVKELLKPDSVARPAIAAAFPAYEHPQIYDRKTKELKRKEFGDLIFKSDAHRKTLEDILHPLVQKSQNDFIREHIHKGMDMVCLDIPLLFEKNRQDDVDITITVSAPDFVQRERVLSRPGMTEEKFNAILERQMPDAEKCALSDYVIKTGIGRAHSMQELKEIIQDIRQKMSPENKKTPKNT